MNQPEQTATEQTAPEYTDVNDSHTLTAGERAELDEMEAEAKGFTQGAGDAENVEGITAEQTASETARQADAPAASAATATEPEAAATTHKAGPELLAVPDAPKDWTAERAALKDAYDNGHLSADEYDNKRDDLADERAAWVAQREMAEQINNQRLNEAKAKADADFNAVSSAWIAKNADFMANPLFAKDMQDAIDLIDQQTGGALSPAELFDRAERAAFEARNWTPKTQAADAPKRDQVREALVSRQPPSAPKTLSAAPSAGIDMGRGSFSDLDSGSILDMEAAVARMSPAELEKFLSEAEA